MGRITNTAIGTATEIAFKDINGNAVVFSSGKRLIVHNIIVNNRATAKNITIFQDADGDDTLDVGEELAFMSFAGVGADNLFFLRGLPSLLINAAGTNTFFAVADAAGAVDLIILGEVLDS